MAQDRERRGPDVGACGRIEHRFGRQQPAGDAWRRLRQGVGAGVGRVAVPAGARKTNGLCHREIDRVGIMPAGRGRRVDSERGGRKQVARHDRQRLVECGRRVVTPALPLAQRAERVPRVGDAFPRVELTADVESRARA